VEREMKFINWLLDALVVPHVDGTDDLADRRWWENEAIFNSRKGYLS
jgi:hypothetical protein